jgi:hypothetical protein
VSFPHALKILQIDQKPVSLRSFSFFVHFFSCPMFTKTKIAKSLPCLLLLVLCILPANAQEAPPTTVELSAADNPLGLAKQPQQTLLSGGLIFASGVQQDAVHSPIRHSGFMGGFVLDLRAYSRDILVKTTSTTAVGLLNPAVGQSRNANAGIIAIQTNTALSLAFTIYTNESRTTRFFAGPLLNPMTNIKINNTFGNSALATDIHLALGGTARIEHDVVFLNRQWRASSEIHLPLVGLAQRPYYSTNSRSIIANETFTLLDFQFVSLFTFPNITWATELEFMLGTGNWLGLRYQWNFYDYAYFNRVQAARHGAVLSLHVRLE